MSQKLSGPRVASWKPRLTTGNSSPAIRDRNFTMPWAIFTYSWAARRWPRISMRRPRQVICSRPKPMASIIFIISRTSMPMCARKGPRPFDGRARMPSCAIISSPRIRSVGLCIATTNLAKPWPRSITPCHPTSRILRYSFMPPSSIWLMEEPEKAGNCFRRRRRSIRLIERSMSIVEPPRIARSASWLALFGNGLRSWAVLCMVDFLFFLAAPVANAHPLSQGAMEIVLGPDSVKIHAVVASEEVLVASAFDDGKNMSPAEKVRRHAQYLIDHLRVTADGRLLVGRVLNAANEFSSRPIYDLEYGPLAGIPASLEVEQDVLREIEFA